MLFVDGFVSFSASTALVVVVDVVVNVSVTVAVVHLLLLLYVICNPTTHQKCGLFTRSSILV